jgi:hypothetical protein
MARYLVGGSFPDRLDIPIDAITRVTVLDPHFYK